MIARLTRWFDERLGASHFVRAALRKAFPDHWSFMLGEINAYAFIVLVATGTFLAFFFTPSPRQVIYHGPYALLDGARVSEAFASVMRLSFDVNLGLLIRQIHHWAALVFVAGIAVHMARVFFTGAFRKPREITWVVGFTLLLLALLAGLTGYSLPDDLLSGTGVRIADSVLLSVPFVGTWASFLFLGGVFPSDALIPRFFAAHVYLLPATIAALIGVHVALVWRQHHTQFPGPGRTERNVVGSPLVPNYAAKSLALFAATVVVLVLLGTFVQINPVWTYGPYHAWQIVSPAQPDWYLGWVDGALRIGPPVALHAFEHSIPSPFLPAVVMPLAVVTLLYLWPWIEAALRRDRDAHNLLDLPRNVPLRTAFGVALIVYAAVLTFAGSGDVQARYLHRSIDAITSIYRWGSIVLPLLAFALTYRIAVELRARGGVHKAPRLRLRRNAAGGFDEEELT